MAESLLKKLIRQSKKRKRKVTKSRVRKPKVPRGLSIKSPGGAAYVRQAERELRKQTASAQKKKK